jgi:hypothetical protein
MKSQETHFFKKTLTCPSSNTLVSFRTRRLPDALGILVRFHLNYCEFCSAELLLLAYHKPPAKGEDKAPEIPMNLRILAESILGQNGKVELIH